MPPTKQHKQERASSLELGDPEGYKMQLNKRGRPARRGAGKKKSVTDFVDSSIIEAEDEESIDSPEVDEDGEPVKHVRPRKRRRSLSPPQAPLEPIIRNEDPDELSEGEPRKAFRKNKDKSPLQIQLNVPLGYHGPLVVKLDQSVLSVLNKDGLDVYPPKQRPTKRLAAEVSEDAVVTTSAKSFTALPPEVRNRIYAEVFVANDVLNFYRPHNFQRSAQFLRTCSTVHTEGASFLYSKNRFCFDRNRNGRKAFWELQDKEIGYKDMRQFLRMIGPMNVALIRDIKITFEDASPSAGEYPSHEARRYINDVHLIDCLRTIRTMKLQKLSLHFQGRRMLFKSDSLFLSYLEDIKTDELHVCEPARWGSKINHDLIDELKSLMVRKKKLYSPQEFNRPVGDCPFHSGAHY